MQMINGHDVHRLLDYPGLVAALRDAPRHAMPGASELFMAEPDSSQAQRGLMTLPAWKKGQMLGVKLVTIFPDNPKATPPRPSNQGLYVAFDGVTGAPVLVADGTALTLRKTAADSALGVDLLARADAATLLVVGAGALIPHVIEAIISVRPSVRTVWIWNRTGAKAQNLAAATRIDGVAVEAVDRLEAVLPLADVVSSATMATEPLIRGALLKEGCHVDLIGGWQPSMREADDDTIRRATLFTDTRDLCRDCGDFLQPVESGLMTWSDIQADLFELCGGSRPARKSEREITLFKNSGGAHLDLFTAQELLRRIRLDREMGRLPPTEPQD
jgi:ornithine cyclodeaminase/alanine dehydrogenase-like protein (mu-crystallin family)